MDNGIGRSPHRLAWDITSFSKATEVSRSQLYKEIRAGRLRITKCGRRTLITHADGIAWVNGLGKSEHAAA